jgi:chlorite dismutase
MRARRQITTFMTRFRVRLEEDQLERAIYQGLATWNGTGLLFISRQACGDRVDVRSAQHAEATLDRIGSQHAPLLRELFRNPVTAPGTGAARDAGNTGFTRLTIRGRSHTLPRHVASEVEYERVLGAVLVRLSAAGRHAGMSMEHSPEGTGPPPRRGPSVDLDPTGIVTGRSPDRQRRQFLNYSFYRLDPVFRRLPADEQQVAAAEFVELVRKWESLDDLILRTYSLVGLRADVDFMLWRIAFDPLCFQSMEAAIRRSRLGAYLSQVHSFFSLQRRSPYVNRSKGAGEDVELLPGEGKYLFVYPFSKTRSWYRLSPHARQGMMDEHIAASAPFKGVRLNTSYSYGIDDQDFVVAFDSDYPQEFVDLVGRLRYTEASLYTQRDTPMFACAKAPIDAILAQLANMD